jgi:hypothetical protein
MSFLSLDSQEIVFKEGSFGTMFYIILKGQVSVSKQEKKLPEENLIDDNIRPKVQLNAKTLKKAKVFI